MLLVFIWIVVVLLGLQLMLLALVITSKIRSLRREGVVEEQIEAKSSHFIAYIEGTTDSAPELDIGLKWRNSVVEGILDRISSSFEEETAKKRLSELAEKYLSSHYRSTLKRGKWADRINALYFIEDFYMSSLREDVFVHFQSLKKQDEEFRQCLLTATSLQESRLLNDILENESISTGLIKEILFRLDDTFLEEMMRRIESDAVTSEKVLFAFITFLGEQKNLRFYPFIEGKLFDERKEVRLKAMNSLSNFEEFSNPHLLAPFFTSEDWEERMYAAKIAGACGLTQYQSSMVELFSDSVWWVRFSAADNIYKFQEGDALLAQVSHKHSDDYARDIAKHMLTRRGGRGK
ncbi:MAG TPA: HEAT repeat domain-containing protein [Planococcus sp. (in: firmicutes)]|nr:HEAT repeat domain-containing protein [Planococcus sp. (in: firmicutes)]